MKSDCLACPNQQLYKAKTNQKRDEISRLKSVEVSKVPCESAAGPAEVEIKLPRLLLLLGVLVTVSGAGEFEVAVLM